jgi:hypothetical protein
MQDFVTVLNVMFKARKPLFFIWFTLLVFGGGHAVAQNWLPGFNFRKRISIKKDQVSGSVNLLNFPVLVSITDPDLRYIKGQCNTNKLSSEAGLDISFSSGAVPGVALKFQLDSYDPATGKLNCWVNLPVLTASGNPAAASVIYLYYGSTQVQEPHGASSYEAWPDFSRLWHMNLDAGPATVMNAKGSQIADMAIGLAGMNANNFTAGKVGAALKLNGSSEAMNVQRDTSTTFTISAWVKMNRLDVEQVLFTNDSIAGYVVKLSASGKLTLDTRRTTGSALVSSMTSTNLTTNEWYYFVVQRDSRARTFYINGKQSAVFTRVENIASGGRLSIGRSKQNDRYFNGLIDELRFTNQIRSADWIKTEYNNQNDPAAFYTVGQEEQNEVSSPTGSVFTGALSKRWSDPGNWNSGKVPDAYANVVVPGASEVIIDDLSPLRVNQLFVGSGATLTVQSSQFFVCKMDVMENAAVQISANTELQVSGDIRNDGLLSGAESGGLLSLTGSQSTMRISGIGRIRVFHLQVNLPAATQTVLLSQAVVVTGKLEVKSGVLSSNGYLTLAASRSQAAAFLPMASPASGAVLGDVVVEKYVEGSFPAPATARGWRLWTSPVYTNLLNGLPVYDLNAFKAAMFVTGKGGAGSGFDESPQNGNTIYTHDQSLAGSLSQKYIPVPGMSTRVALGKGVYVYSRGAREGPDAFKNQVLSAPFINPEPYTISFVGKLFSGELKVALSNRDQKEAGDGFNLLGNPYASPVRWGSLLKENSTAFVWQFNPLNNAYDVSDNADLLIPAGAGFFVKVKQGERTGSITFQEASKGSSGVHALAADVAEPGFLKLNNLFLSTEQSSGGKAASLVKRRLEVGISRAEFQQKYILKLDEDGLNEVTDADAPSLGDGFVNIAGLSADNQKLMIDSRSIAEREVHVNLYVKGWATGSYELRFSGMDSFDAGDSLLLEDKYLQTTTLVAAATSRYVFQIQAEVPESQGAGRFALTIKKVLERRNSASDLLNRKQLLVYPNPFVDVIHVQSAEALPEKIQVLIRDMSGRVLLVCDNSPEGQATSFQAGQLPKGLYILELRDSKRNKRIKTFKIVKL